jgi:hypothetical protein
MAACKEKGLIRSEGKLRDAGRGCYAVSVNV